MGKSDAEVIALFHEQVNMSANELDAWLDDPQSRQAGTGVGHESGRRIVAILRKNPDRNPDAYDEVSHVAARLTHPFDWRVASQEDIARDCGARWGRTETRACSSDRGRETSAHGDVR